jgi:hypothetical protein
MKSKLAKVAIRSAPEKLQQLFFEIRKQRGHVLEAFNPERVIALLPANAQLQWGELLGRAENSTSQPAKLTEIQGTQPLSGRAVAAGRNADGRLEVFYIGMDDLPYHKWQLRRMASGAGRTFSARSCRARRGKWSSETTPMAAWNYSTLAQPMT